MATLEIHERAYRLLCNSTVLLTVADIGGILGVSWYGALVGMSTAAVVAWIVTLVVMVGITLLLANAAMLASQQIEKMKLQDRASDIMFKFTNREIGS